MVLIRSTRWHLGDLLACCTIWCQLGNILADPCFCRSQSFTSGQICDSSLKEGGWGACQADGCGGMQERVIGQADAVSAVARAMKRARSGLKDPRRPIAAMLFAGPTGVGKTELTKVPLPAAFL